MTSNGEIKEFLKDVWIDASSIPSYSRVYRSIPHHTFDFRIFNRFTENILVKLSLT
jgi:hypothetical protein